MFGKKVVKNKLSSSTTNANCDLDMDRFSDILESKITGTINCLEKNLNIFMDVSELGRGKKLSRTALIKYLKRNRPDTTPKTISVINTVFALSTLITGEEKDFISRGNVTKIINLVRIFNSQAASHYPNTFGSSAPASLSVHESHRRRVDEAAKAIQAAISEIYLADRNGEIHYVDTMDILKGFIVDDEESIEKIEGILFVKKILMGGDINRINHQELGFLFSQLPKLLTLVLDGVRYKDLTMEQPELMEFIHADVIDLSNILFHPSRGNRNFEGLFDVDVAITGIDRFIKDDDKKISKYRVLIKEAVRIFTRIKNGTPALDLYATDEQWVTGRELEKFFSHIYTVTKRAQAFHKFYNSPNIKPLLISPQSVYLDPAKFQDEFPDNRLELIEFCRIVSNFRYMKGSQDMASYSLEFRRNPNAVAEVTIYEYLISQFFGYYGSSNSMSNKQLMAIMKKFENELIEMDIILPRRSRSTAETISLLGSLFQAQSDNNELLDVNEAAEFAISLVTAIDAKKKLFAFYETKDCAAPAMRDQFGRIAPECFKNNFFEAICNSYRDQLPRLFSYLGADPKLGCNQNFNSEHNIAYANAAAVAARTCHFYPDDGSEIMYSESDIMSIILAMMHIETTITRWDKNINNTMDPKEVVDAWAIYKPAIIGMLGTKLDVLPAKLKETLALLVYQYLVKFEEAPALEGKDLWKTIGKLGKLLVKKAPASRKSIASILRIVSEQGKVKAQAEYDADPNAPGAEKPFDCNWLRDPDNIPRD